MEVAIRVIDSQNNPSAVIARVFFVFSHRPTASDCLTAPVLPRSRNTLLPPIGTGDPESSHSVCKPAQVG